MAANPALQHSTLPPEALSPNFLQSPISVLLQSLYDTLSDEISLHDLSQAYSTLCERIKTLSAVLVDSTVRPPALETLYQHSPQIYRSLRRDISRLRQNPLPQLPERNAQIPKSAASTTPEYSDEDLKHGLDISDVGQHALLLSSFILRLPMLFNLFDGMRVRAKQSYQSHNIVLGTGDAIKGILQEIVDIVKQAVVPTPHGRRTYSLAFWILSSHALPKDLFSPTKRDTISILRRVLKDDVDANVDEVNLADALKVFPPQSASVGCTGLTIPSGRAKLDDKLRRYIHAHRRRSRPTYLPTSPLYEEAHSCRGGQRTTCFRFSSVLPRIQVLQ